MVKRTASHLFSDIWASPKFPSLIKLNWHNQTHVRLYFWRIVRKEPIHILVNQNACCTRNLKRFRRRFRRFPRAKLKDICLLRLTLSLPLKNCIVQTKRKYFLFLRNVRVSQTFYPHYNRIILSIRRLHFSSIVQVWHVQQCLNKLILHNLWVASIGQKSREWGRANGKIWNPESGIQNLDIMNDDRNNK